MPRVEQGQIVEPKFVPRKGSEDCKQFRDCRRCPWRVWVSRMSHNPQNPIFGQWACSPRSMALSAEPVVGPIVLDVGRIDERDQYIHVEEEPGHGSSSWSWRTSSEVTLDAPGRTESRGTPLRVPPLEGAGRSAVLASEEITSPTVFRSEAAISFAAERTSSSIARVVRNGHPPLSHHASIITHQDRVV